MKTLADIFNQTLNSSTQFGKSLLLDTLQKEATKGKFLLANTLQKEALQVSKINNNKNKISSKNLVTTPSTNKNNLVYLTIGGIILYFIKTHQENTSP